MLTKWLNGKNKYFFQDALHPMLVTDKLQKPIQVPESETKQTSTDAAHGGTSHSVCFPQEMP